MKKYFKIILLIFLGLITGLLIHGIIEIVVIRILIVKNVLMVLSWKTWLDIHFLYSIIIEVLGIILIFWINNKFQNKWTL